MIALDGLGHDWSAEFDRRAWKWLDGVLKTPTGKPTTRGPGKNELVTGED